MGTSPVPGSPRMQVQQSFLVLCFWSSSLVTSIRRPLSPVRSLPLLANRTQSMRLWPGFKATWSGKGRVTLGLFSSGDVWTLRTTVKHHLHPSWGYRIMLECHFHFTITAEYFMIPTQTNNPRFSLELCISYRSISVSGRFCKAAKLGVVRICQHAVVMVVVVPCSSRTGRRLRPAAGSSAQGRTGSGCSTCWKRSGDSPSVGETLFNQFTTVTHERTPAVTLPAGCYRDRLPLCCHT